MEKFYLEKPTLNRKEEAIEYIEEFYKYKSNINGAGRLQKYLDDYEGWLKYLDENYSIEPSEKGVPRATYFLIRENDNKIIGTINIRFCLNERLKKCGGNIGYGIRPTERNKGYNKINLYLGLKVCQKHNMKEVMLDADINNPASWKTMEALGGVRIGEHFDDSVNEDIVTYKIDVDKAINEHKEFEQ